MDTGQEGSGAVSVAHMGFTCTDWWGFSWTGAMSFGPLPDVYDDPYLPTPRNRHVTGAMSFGPLPDVSDDPHLPPPPHTRHVTGRDPWSPQSRRTRL